MGGPPEHHIRAEDLAGVPGRQILLTQMQHIGTRRQRDIGTIVDREQRTVTAGRGLQLGERREFALGLERAELPLPGRALVPELDDVHATGEGRFRELGEVPLLPAGVGAQVQPGGREAVARGQRSASGGRLHSCHRNRANVEKLQEVERSANIRARGAGGEPDPAGAM